MFLGFLEFVLIGFIGLLIGPVSVFFVQVLYNISISISSYVHNNDLINFLNTYIHKQRIILPTDLSSYSTTLQVQSIFEVAPNRRRNGNFEYLEIEVEFPSQPLRNYPNLLYPLHDL